LAGVAADADAPAAALAPAAAAGRTTGAAPAGRTGGVGRAGGAGGSGTGPPPLRTYISQITQKTSISSIDRTRKGQKGKVAPGVETLSVPVSGVKMEAAASGATLGAGDEVPPVLVPVPGATGAEAAPPGAAGAELALTLAAGLGAAVLVAVGAAVGVATGAAVGGGGTGDGEGGSGATDGFTAGFSETSELPVPSMCPWKIWAIRIAIRASAANDAGNR
jgi:hypothetical protein